MLEYITTETDFKEDIIDFINYVFSQSRKPHDFKTLVPKSYADDAKGLGAVHYIAKKDGKIKAVVATRIIDVFVNGKILKYGLIGNVAVHPYSRGEGYMKTLLNIAIEDAKERKIDILALAGQRQRYGYFGFENAGSNFSFELSSANIRHCFGDIDCSDITLKPMTDATEAEIDTALSLYEKKVFHCIRPRDEFRIIMRTWSSPCFIIYKNEKMIGYAFGPFHEVILENEMDFPAVLKAFFEKDNISEIGITVPAYLSERAKFLSGICECCGVVTAEMTSVLNWKNTLDGFLSLKSTYTALQDGITEFAIDDEALRITVENGVPYIEETTKSQNMISFTKSEAQQKFFDIPSLLFPDEHFKNWLPLPFVIDAPDSY